MDLAKYLKINNLTHREMAEKLSDPIARKKFNLPPGKVSHAAVGIWARKESIPSLPYMKILQVMTHGKISMKDFLTDEA